MPAKTKAYFYLIIFISLLVSNPSYANKKNAKDIAKIGVIPLETPKNFLNPKAQSLVQNLITDTHDQIRDSATGIIHKHNLVGIGVTNPEILCENPAGMSEFNSDYLHCGIYAGEQLALRPSNEKVQQQMIRHYYQKATILGDRYKNGICDDNNFTSLLYLRSSNISDLINNLNTQEKKLAIQISVTAYTRGSNHESTEYIDIDLFKTKNNWEYDRNLVKSKVEQIAFTAYDKVLKSHTITYSSKGTATLDGF